MREETFEFNGHTAQVIIPDKPNGKWIWKTEFFRAFDQAEVALCERGYTRVHYQIPDMYGSFTAVRLMRAFYHEVRKRYNLCEKAHLFGFSRGGLYAFNFALFYPEYVGKIYLDAPVLDMRVWPREGTVNQEQMFAQYCLNKDTFARFCDNPVDNMQEFFAHKIPLMIISGDKDESVPIEKCAGVFYNYCKENNIDIKYIVKPGAGHHPHSLEDVTPIVEFIEND